jgi:hypothetical protein
LSHRPDGVNHLGNHLFRSRLGDEAAKGCILPQVVEQLPNLGLKNDKDREYPDVQYAPKQKVEGRKPEKSHSGIQKNDKKQSEGGLYGKSPFDPPVEIIEHERDNQRFKQVSDAEFDKTDWNQNVLNDGVQNEYIITIYAVNPKL